MSYVTKFSRSNTGQAVVGDWVTLSGMRVRNAEDAEYLELGFSPKAIERIKGPKSYDDAIIASLESTHRNEKIVASIFNNAQQKVNFSNIIIVKSVEFEKSLELIALQSPVNLVCTLMPSWIENRRVFARVRREFSEVIKQFRFAMFEQKESLYSDFKMESYESYCMDKNSGRGRVKIPNIEEMIHIDSALKESKEMGLSGIEKYLFVAKKACTFVDQICWREEHVKNPRV